MLVPYLVLKYKVALIRFPISHLFNDATPSVNSTSILNKLASLSGDKKCNDAIRDSIVRPWKSCKVGLTIHKYLLFN